MRQFRRRLPLGEPPAWVTAVGLSMDAHPWAYFAGFFAMCGCWGGGWALLAGEPSRPVMAIAGLLFITGGFVEVFLARPLAKWREDAPWWWRVSEEGAWAMVDYGPNTFRFVGSAVAGLGVGLMAWTIWPHMGLAFGLGIMACLGLWVWTWFAFPSMEDE